ncbi:hypothetical protein X011_04325 [Mycobacterium tuberculosis variant microti OV254]|nr:hypothetical protein X011_04325 [Mycobacterium tuberculosis variant microti OV254]
MAVGMVSRFALDDNCVARALGPTIIFVRDSGSPT